MKTPIWILFNSPFLFHVTFLLPNTGKNQKASIHQINSIFGKPTQSDDDLVNFSKGRFVQKVTITEAYMFEGTKRRKEGQPRIIPMINDLFIVAGLRAFGKARLRIAVGEKITVLFRESIDSPPGVMKRFYNSGFLKEITDNLHCTRKPGSNFF